MKRADHHLVQQVLDGDIDREGFDGFQRRLRTEPDLERLYGDYALLQHTLCEEFEGGHSIQPDAALHGRSVGGRVLLVALFLLILLASAWWLRPHFAPLLDHDVAVGTFSLDAVWQIDGASRNLGGATGMARGTKLHLRQGRADISLIPSVNATIEGPATVIILSEDSLYLAQGKGYFRCSGNGRRLTVTTPKLTAVDSGTEFGIDTSPESHDEVHVAVGSVRVLAKASGEESLLAAGDAVQVPASGPMTKLPAAVSSFATELGRFSTLITGPIDQEQWRVAYGNPAISPGLIEGVNYAVFLRLPQEAPTDDSPILIATIDIGEAFEGSFHTDGWAGMSFYSNGTEVVFFGDSFGTADSWSLDVKQRIPVIYPPEPVRGEGKVTMRYDMRSGEVSLHEGGLPLGTPFSVGKLPAGTRFDEIRIGASSGAALAVKSLIVRSGGR